MVSTYINFNILIIYIWLVYILISSLFINLYIYTNIAFTLINTIQKYVILVKLPNFFLLFLFFTNLYSI